jgi:hypothetical protein
MKDKQSLQARAEAAEARVRDVLAMRDAVVEERSRALENLAGCQAEKTGGEELVRRCELQIRTLTDDKAAAVSRAEGAEERTKELTRQRDAAQSERSKLTEQLGVAHTERRAVEEGLRLTEVTSTRHPNARRCTEHPRTPRTARNACTRSQRTVSAGASHDVLPHHR